MRIVTPIKQVPETNAVRMDEATGTMVRDGVETIVNPLDLYAVEAALRFREAAGESIQITAITMGPPAASRALKEVVSMGVDEAVLVTDKAFAGADTWSTSYVLAAAIRKIGGADLILCGERATDGDTGQVGPGVAAFLSLPVATYVSRISQISPAVCEMYRLIENGHEILEVELPAVATVVKEIAEPRLPTLHGKRRARDLQLTTFGVNDLDLDPALLGLKGSPTRVVRIFRPKVTRECEMIVAADTDGVDRAVRRIVERLREKETA